MKLIRKNNAPVCSVSPTLYGSGEIGRVLFLVSGEYTTDDFWFRREYKWFKNGVQIDGETRPTYLVRSGDALGALITCDEIVTTWLGQSTTTRTASKTVIAATTLTDITAASQGLKSLSTTGSITSGTNTLTVASATGFSINDGIIVETGTETGLGLRGTMGVGGAWPALSYANAAARIADTGQANNTSAWDRDTGNTYKWVSGAWTSPYSSDYYRSKAQPKALVTTITGIAGNTLTLADNASATATNANVYFDNSPIWDVISDQVVYQDWSTSPLYRKRLTFPSGTFAFSALLSFSSEYSSVIEGAGKNLTNIKSPRGCFPLWISVGRGLDTGEQVHIRGVHLESNWGDYGPYFSRLGQDPGYTLLHAVLFEVTKYCTIEDCKITNPATYSVAGRGSDYIYGYDCESISDDGHQFYLQWQFVLADGEGGGFWDCSVTSPYLMGAFETFRNRNTQFVRCNTENGAYSANASGGFLFDDCVATMTGDAQKVETDGSLFWDQSSPVININANISSEQTELGGWVRNPTFTQLTPYNTKNHILTGITIAPEYLKENGDPNVLISGEYPRTPFAKGLFTFPVVETPTTGGSFPQGCPAIMSNGKCVIRGIRVTGALPATIRGDTVPFGAKDGWRITQCVVDYIDIPSGANVFLAGNLTNDEYEAL